MKVLLNDNKICTLEYYLDPDTGVMARNTTIDGHEMNSSGVKVS